MKVVALISGGKDSCFSMVQCVMAGHEIVALANIRPENQDELDSYMYQTVGHQGIQLYAEAMNIPLYRQSTVGIALKCEKLYSPTPEDEVEDLYKLLANVKNEIEIEAVAVGAVLSDYQRIRVENVCSRLGLVPLAYLWRRDQGDLLQEMIDYNIEAVIIKVAALGLDPSKHLGKSISEIQPHLIKMNEKYGLNICGEGGEYETFTLDCPLFIKSLIIEDYETVIHSNDAIAPVGYMKFKNIHLKEKEGMHSNMTLRERLENYPFKTAEEYVRDIDQTELTDTENDKIEDGGGDLISIEVPNDPLPLLEIKESDPAPSRPSFGLTSSGWCWIGGVVGENEDIGLATTDALSKLGGILQERGLDFSNLVCVSVFVRDLSQYAVLNSAYLNIITGPSPPVRVCLGCGLNEKTPVLLNAVAYSKSKNTMHVQSLSHWAPANIGPYSQAVQVEDIVYVAGQIGLIPGSMELVSGGIRRQCKLALRHISSLTKAVDKDTQLRDIVQGVCFVTNSSFIGEVRKEWERRSNNAIVDYVVVPELPKSALVEWQVWVHRGNSRFDYEETGCVVGNNRVSLRRRWNYENTVSAVVCSVSTVSSVSNPEMSEKGPPGMGCEPLTESQLGEVLQYALSRLFKGSLDQFIAPSSLTSDSETEEQDTTAQTVPNILSPLPLCSLHLYYRVGRSPRPSVIHNVISNLNEFNVVATLIPVCQLNHPNTFLSLSAVRYD